MREHPKLRYVDWQKGRDGVTWYPYFRDNGVRHPLPAWNTPEFHTEYGRRLEEKRSRTKVSAPPGYLPGTWGELTTQYLASDAFIGLSPNSKRLYRPILERLADNHGHKRVEKLRRDHIERWKADLASTPSMANMTIKVARLLLNSDERYRKDNPAAGIDLYDEGEHRAWTDDECATFESRWESGTMERRAYMLAKYTGQRCSDLAAMTRADRNDGRIHVVQEKTGARLWIKELASLAAELRQGEQHMMLLTTKRGAKFTPRYLSNWFAQAIGAAGLPDGCVMHGLRKTAACLLIEAGATHMQAMAVTGHKDLKVFMDYVKDANQKVMADDAIDAMERNTRRTKTAKHHLTKSAKQATGD